MPQSQYIYDRDFKGSNRLNMNHWLFKGLSGFLLHPSIRYSHDVRIADIGAGTAIWLQELAESLRAPAKLVGFDNSPDQFPPPRWRMPNVELIAHDCIKDPFSQEHIGKYDIVVIKFFRCVVEGNDLTLLLKNIMSLLKPGGYLQWFDVLGSQTDIYKSEPSTKTQVSDVLKGMSISPPHGNLPADWIDQLPNTLKTHGMDLVVEERIHMRDPYRMVWGQSMLAGIEETTISGIKRKQIAEEESGANKTEQEKQDELDAAITRAQGFIDGLSKEMSQGALVEHPVLCLVARKK